MTGCDAYIVRVSAWAPGIENSSEWDEWAAGKRSISPNGKSPEILFTDPLFRRRLSQVSKMTIQVIHDLLPVSCGAKIIFLSFRGEQCRQFQINKMLLEENGVSPAAFSLSVYNAPAALASIALGLKGGYSALFPVNDSFAAGLMAAQAALFSGNTHEILFAYADEEAPPEFSLFAKDFPAPAAIGLLISRTQQPDSIKISPVKAESDSPLAFLKKLLLQGKLHVSA